MAQANEQQCASPLLPFLVGFQRTYTLDDASCSVEHVPHLTVALSHPLCMCFETHVEYFCVGFVCVCVCARSYLAIASTLAQKLLTVDYGTRGPARSKLVLVGDGVVS